jgi:membrane fusion protein, multidrug efflux system
MRALLAALVLAAAVFATASAQQQPAEPSVLVRTMPPRQGSLAVTVRAYGLVQTAPGATLDISMPRPGQVLHLRVVAGQHVNAGDPLFEYGAEPADLLAYQQAQSALTLARQERTHVASLFAQKLATQSQLDQAEKAVRDAEAAVAVQRQLGGGQPAQRVSAPFSGLVAALAATNGAHVQANATILQLAEDGRLEAVLGVAAEVGPRLSAGLPVRLAALAAPATPIEAKIASVAGQLDPKTQLVDIVVPLPSDDRAVLAGEHVSAEIAAGNFTGWIVPRPAVLTDDNGAYLYQVAAGKARRVAVAVVGEAGDSIAVSGPLDHAGPIVISGNYELADGMAVREQRPSTSPPAGARAGSGG